MTRELSGVRQALVANDATVSAQVATAEEARKEDRKRFDGALSEMTARAETAARERDHAAARLQALQQAVQTRDTDWATKVRSLEQQLRAAAESARVQTAAVATPAPAPVPTRAPVAAAPAAVPVAAKPAAPQPPAAVAKPLAGRSVL